MTLRGYSKLVGSLGTHGLVAACTADIEDEAEELSPLEEIERRTHEDRVSMVLAEGSSKRTDAVYRRHHQAYERFIASYNVGDGRRLAPYPVVASKVFLFLQDQGERGHWKSKKGGGFEEVEGTNLSAGSLKQVSSLICVAYNCH